MKNLTAFFCLGLIFILTAENAFAQFVCQREQTFEIEGSIAAGDNLQLGRLSRDGSPSNCSGSTSTLENNIGVRRDTHNFVNPFNEDVCVRVEMDFTACGGNQIQSAAYSSFNPLNPALGVLGDSGFSTINTGSYSFSVGPNAAFSVGVNEVTANSGCPYYRVKVTYLRNCRQPGFDATNDGRADIAVYRPGPVSKWWSIDSATSDIAVRDFGTTGDVVTGGSDYTGDGQTDLSIYRPNANSWLYGLDQNVPGQNFQTRPWGTAGDQIVPGDFDGDGINDVAVWRPSNGNFYVLRSSDGSFQQRQWGGGADQVVSGDFDGDTVTDFAIVRPTIGGIWMWWILKSNYNHGFSETIQWGFSNDKVVPADYDGDTITDIAIWRASEGNFYVRRSSDQTMQVFHWGALGDVPQPADYDGDGRADFAVWRPSNGAWYINNSETGTFKVMPFGQQGDQPATAAYRIQ